MHSATAGRETNKCGNGLSASGWERERGRPWRQTAKKNFSDVSVSWHGATRVARDRSKGSPTASAGTGGTVAKHPPALAYVPLCSSSRRDTGDTCENQFYSAFMLVIKSTVMTYFYIFWFSCAILRVLSKLKAVNCCILCVIVLYKLDFY